MTTSYPLSKIKVVLLENVHAKGVRMLREAGYTVETHAGALHGEELIEAAGDAHIVGIRSKTKLDAAFFGHAHRLWAVGCFCIGTNQVDLPAAAARGVAVFNAPFSNTRSVAEKTIAEIIVLHRRLFDRSAALHAGRWIKSASGSHEVRGRTLGIIGYGRIGSQVSVLAEAMGMRVVYYDATATLPLGNARSVETIDELLAESDCVTLHVPEAPSTEQLLGARELGLMKEGAYLINNARGGVVDVAALVEAIRSGHLAGAAVDVFPSEPESNDAAFETPLAGLENVILSPHVGGSTLEAQANIGAEVGEKLVRLMNNGSTSTAVNLPNVELPTLHEGHHRVLHIHRNIPGVLGELHSAVARRGINVAASFLQSDSEHGYAIMDITPPDASKQERAFLDELRSIPGTIRAREVW